VSGTFATTLAISPAAGRLFRPEEDFRGGPAPGVVLSYPFWQKEFGGSHSAIGSRLVVQNRSLEVVGVTPAGFAGPEVGLSFDLALPLCSLSVTAFLTVLGYLFMICSSSFQQSENPPTLRLG
jgi:putative ABC transport system permease protein